MVGVTVVGGLWSVAGRWAVVLYYAAFISMHLFIFDLKKAW